MATITRLKPKATIAVSHPDDGSLPTLEQVRRFANEANLLRPRENRGYSIYQVADRYVYKRYHYPLNRRFTPREREWEHEHAILSALSDHPGVPRSYGRHYENRRGEQVYHCLRQYIPGHTLEARFTREQAAAAGELIASLHMHLVTTNDPQGKNFICDDNGQVFFIDFGKASVFKRRTFLYYAHVGRELFKFFYGGVHWDPQLWRIFLIHYYQGVDFSLAERGLIRSCYGIFMLHRVVRHLLRGKPIKA